MMIVPGACWIGSSGAGGGGGGGGSQWHFSFDGGVMEDCQGVALTNSGVMASVAKKRYGNASALFSGAEYFVIDTPLAFTQAENWSLSFWFYSTTAKEFHILHDASIGKITGIYLKTGATVEFLFSEFDRAVEHGDTDMLTDTTVTGWNFFCITNDVAANETKMWLNENLQTGAVRDIAVYAFGASTRISAGVEYYLGSAASGDAYIDDILITNTLMDGSYMPAVAADCNTLGASSEITLFALGNNFTDGDLGDAVGGQLEPQAGASIDNTVKPFGTGSFKFVEASSQYLKFTPVGNIPLLGSGDWTVDLHHYIDSTATSPTQGGLFKYGPLWMQYNADQYRIFSASNGAAGTGTSWMFTGTAITKDAWVHVRLCKEGSTMYFYVGGVLIGSVAEPSWYDPIDDSYQGAIGYDNNTGITGGWFHGVRVTRGTALKATGLPISAEYTYP